VTLGWPRTDRLPVENGPDVAAAVTIDGLGAWTAEGIDVSCDLGWSREPVMSAVNDRLAITDLLVEDYPTFLRVAVPRGSARSQRPAVPGSYT
jgi:hypothetical protein